MDEGALLGGKYRLGKRLGRGGMGEVWSARDEALGRPVAVKILLAALDGDANLVARLRQEARTAAALQHPGITVVHDIGDHNGHPFFVMELLNGRTFGALLAENPDSLPAERTVELMARVTDALAYAHDEGVVHRDIKPANLMYLAGGGVKICDFGIARYAEATVGLTATRGVLGTPVFMAPEQWRAERVDARTDLYAFGATLHTLLTGAPPFPGPTQHALMSQHLTAPPPHVCDARPDLPKELDDLLQQLLAKQRGDRPATATEVGQTLQVIQAQLTGTKVITPPHDNGKRGKPPEDSKTKPPSPAKDTGVGWAVAAIIMVVLAIFGLKWVKQQNDPSNVACRAAKDAISQAVAAYPGADNRSLQARYQAMSDGLQAALNKAKPGTMASVAIYNLSRNYLLLSQDYNGLALGNNVSLTLATSLVDQGKANLDKSCG